MDIDRGGITIVRPRVEPVEHVERHTPDDSWVHWPIHWNGIWVGALAALATTLIFGLIGIAVGAHQVGPARNIVRWSDFGFGALVFSVFGAFIAFVVGGWLAGRIAGIRRSEPSMLHGGIVWLWTVPLLLILASLGAGNYFGSWYGGLMGNPIWVPPTTAAVDPTAATVARNSALGALTALLLGLVGSVVGGWMASGEPMTFTHYRERDRDLPARRRVA
jgi:uncharacterized membrane protein YeaQ/YmgE (transglycosylase-associated protein family)